MHARTHTGAESEDAAAEQQQIASTRGRAQPWHQEDVVVFLSQEGDSEPVYLWRNRPESEESLTSGGVGPSMAAEVKALADPPGGVERMHNTVNKHEIVVFCAQCRTD